MTDLTTYVTDYLTSVGSGNFDPGTVAAAIKAETVNQLRACTVPAARTVTVDTTLDSASLDSDSFNGYDIGAAVTGDGIPDGTMVLSVDRCDVTLSSAATADGTDVELAVTPDVSDLTEALARRVAANLANRNLPLGVQSQVAEFGSTSARVGGNDREVRRLEGPYRIIPAG